MIPISFADLLRTWLNGRVPESTGSLFGCSGRTVRNWLNGSLPPATKARQLAQVLYFTDRFPTVDELNDGEQRLLALLEADRKALAEAP